VPSGSATLNFENDMGQTFSISRSFSASKFYTVVIRRVGGTYDTRVYADNDGNKVFMCAVVRFL
jgi:hypothetical protein